MANIIVIERDQKVRRQVEQYFSELSEEHRVRIFTSPTEFENTYFSKIIKDRAQSANELSAHPDLKSFNSQQFSLFNTKSISETPAFPNGKFKLVLLPDFKVANTPGGEERPAEILGRPTEELSSENNLDLAVQKSFAQNWKDFLTHTKESGHATATLCFTSPDDSIWIIRVTSAVRRDNLIDVELEDLTESVKPKIEEYRQRLAEENSHGDELRLLSTIHLVIVRADSLSEGPVTWVKRVRETMKALHYFPSENVTRFVLTKFEDETVSKVSLIHPFIDDLVYLPLDRLLFMQKMDILLRLPEKASPRFLYNQDTAEQIEMAKLSSIERLSDVGMAIRNPVPLVSGLTGHFYFQPPSAKEEFNIYGKVFKSIKDPDAPDLYLVYFMFFGVKREEVMALRSHLARDPHYQSLKNDDKEAFNFNPYNLFLTEEQKRPRNIVVIDPDEDSRSRIVEMIEGNLDNVKVLEESSYTLFIRRQLAVIDGKQKSLAEMPPLPPVADVTRHDLFNDNLKWIIDAHSKNLVSVETPPNKDDEIFGYAAEDFFSHPQTWLNLFTHKETESLLEECIRLAFIGLSTKHVVLLHHQSGDYKPALLRCRPTPKKENIAIELSLPTKKQQEQIRKANEGLESVDLLIMESALIPDNIDEWSEQINEWLNNRELLVNQEQVPVVLISESEKNASRVKLSDSPVAGLHYKPVDHRALLFQMSEILDSPFTRYNFENVGWSTHKIPVHVSKDVHLEQLSEFGATIKINRPLQPGTTLFLRRSIFDNAPNSNLAARFYHCEVHPSEKGFYLCSALYFGINEQFLKFARAWFREQYAASKAEEA